jgi:hypothetical protein
LSLRKQSVDEGQTPNFQIDSIIIGDNVINIDMDTDENGSPREPYQAAPVTIRRRINLQAFKTECEGLQ